MIDHLEFIFAEAVTALRRNMMMTVAAVNTCAVALFILGGLGYTYLSLTSYLDTLPSKFGLTFSVKAGTPMEQVRQMAGNLRKVDGVSRVVWMPKETTWKQYAAQKKYEGLMKDVANPLPNQLLVVLSDLKKTDSVKAAIQKQPYFDNSDTPPIRDAIQERVYVTSLIDFVEWLGSLLSIVTIFTAVTLILNAVHLTVLARRQEIRIMRLVGASSATIRWPFLLEGGIQGLVGGALAGLLLWGLAIYLKDRMGSWLGPFRMTGYTFPALRMALFLSVVGIVLGMLSAALSVRKYLRVAN